MATIHAPYIAPADIVCIQKLMPDLKSRWYRSTIDVQGRHFSGLFLFKTMPDSSVRVVFTNEAGVTFFDYEFSRTGKFRVVEGIKPLRRKIVSETLRKDLALITLMKVRTSPTRMVASGNLDARTFTFGPDDDINQFSVNDECSALTLAERFSKNSKKATASFFGNAAAPDSIFISHVDFDMDIRLRHLKK